MGTSTIAEKYDFKYECVPNNIDINTLLLSQLHFVSIITEIQKNLYPDYNLKIKVEAPKDGSFIFKQVYELVSSSSLFSKENVEYGANSLTIISSLFGTLFGLYKIRKLLKGSKADEVKDEGDFVKIIKDSSEISVDKNVFVLYQSNPIINISINNHFQTIQNDENINGIDIKSQRNNESEYNITKDEFQDFTAVNEYLGVDNLERPKQGQWVFIKKPDLISKKDRVVWSVIYDSREIRATISDKSFINRINSGLRVAQGDSMLVDMKITAVFDKIYNTHIDKSFEIIKVIDYKERSPMPFQNKLYDN